MCLMWFKKTIQMKKIFNIQLNKNKLLHIAFWCVYASFFFFQISHSRGGTSPDWNRIYKDFAFHFVTMPLICYLNYFIFLPRFLKEKNLGRYLLEFLPVFGVFSYLVLIGKQSILANSEIPPVWLSSTRFIVMVTLNSLFLVVFIGLLKFLEDWFELEAAKKELENERLTSELRFLKAQINPHFLFNTLNNLYYLAFTNSPNTTEVIAKLSQMMRYMIYDSNHLSVPLDKEIEYIENYISLEKLRLNEEVPIDFKVEGMTGGLRIVPLVLITFLENAFKHGINSTTKDSFVDASIEISGKTCVYTVTNSKVSDSGKTVTEKSGIGLQNVKRRLELSYPNDYELNVNETEKTYSVTLKLNLI